MPGPEVVNPVGAFASFASFVFGLNKKRPFPTIANEADRDRAIRQQESGRAGAPGYQQVGFDARLAYLHSLTFGGGGGGGPDTSVGGGSPPSSAPGPFPQGGSPSTGRFPVPYEPPPPDLLGDLAKLGKYTARIRKLLAFAAEWQAKYGSSVFFLTYLYQVIREFQVASENEDRIATEAAARKLKEIEDQARHERERAEDAAQNEKNQAREDARIQKQIDAQRAAEERAATKEGKRIAADEVKAIKAAHQAAIDAIKPIVVRVKKRPMPKPSSSSSSPSILQNVLSNPILQLALLVGQGGRSSSSRITSSVVTQVPQPYHDPLTLGNLVPPFGSYFPLTQGKGQGKQSFLSPTATATVCSCHPPRRAASRKKRKPGTRRICYDRKA